MSLISSDKGINKAFLPLPCPVLALWVPGLCLELLVPQLTKETGLGNGGTAGGRMCEHLHVPVDPETRSLVGCWQEQPLCGMVSPILTRKAMLCGAECMSEQDTGLGSLSGVPLLPSQCWGPGLFSEVPNGPVQVAVTGLDSVFPHVLLPRSGVLILYL